MAVTLNMLLTLSAPQVIIYWLGVSFFLYRRNWQNTNQWKWNDGAQNPRLPPPKMVKYFFSFLFYAHPVVYCWVGGCIVGNFMTWALAWPLEIQWRLGGNGSCPVSCVHALPYIRSRLGFYRHCDRGVRILATLGSPDEREREHDKATSRETTKYSRGNPDGGRDSWRIIKRPMTTFSFYKRSKRWLRLLLFDTPCVFLMRIYLGISVGTVPKGPTFHRSPIQTKLKLVT